MTDESQDSIRKTLADALNKIYLEHGVCITELSVEWLETRTGIISKKRLTDLEIEAVL